MATYYPKESTLKQLFIFLLVFFSLGNMATPKGMVILHNPLNHYIGTQQEHHGTYNN